MKRTRTRGIAIAVAVVLAPALRAADWPAYKHDVQRSSVSAESPTFPLRLAWEYRCAQPPSPAWPDTFRLLNRTDFDYAPHPVIAGGIVCFGSSADDTVRALDAKTGQEKWHFIAGGPVRFAPQIDSGKVFFASDDGFVYCLDAGTGKLAWKFQAAPHDERMVGNHRMISRWPVRTGVLVADGVVYGVAGMWNMEGVFVYALQADTGKVVWCNDTLGLSSVVMVDFPASADPSKETVGGHNGEFAANGAVGANPQGNLLLWKDTLLVPNGNSGPTALDRRTGIPSPKGGGGRAPVTIDQGKVYGFYRHHEDILSFSPFSLDSGAAPRGWGKEDVPQAKITPPKLGQVHDRTKVSAVVREGKLYARVAYGVALAGGALLMGEEDAIIAQDPDTERVLWRAAVTGEAREIAVADGRLYVGTSRGVVYCFEPAARGTEATAAVHDPAAAIRSAAQPPPSAGVAAIVGPLHKAGMDRGFALVVGDADGTFSTTLAANTQLRIINALTDETKAAALREQLLARTALYGTRVHVQSVKSMTDLPFAQFFANAVIVAGPVPGLSAKELYRVLHPCGGLLLVPGLKAAEAEAFVKNTGAIEAEIHAAPGECFVSRGKLPGALDWDTARNKGVPFDQRVKWPLRPLWYGGPGTWQVQGVIGGGGPVVANGRYIVKGEQSLTAVDAYNGAILWSHLIPPSAPDYCTVDGVIYPVADQTKHERGDLGCGYQADDDYVYVQLGAAYFEAVGDELSSALGQALPAKSQRAGRIQLDAHTGEQLKIAAPFNPPEPVSLKAAKKWSLEVDPRRSGAIAMESTARGLELTLTTKDPLVTKLDGWDLFFDFRPLEARYGLYERGTFQVRIHVARDNDTPASWAPGSGSAHPAINVAGTREPTGTKTVVLLPWSELEKLVGSKPSSFGFAVTLNSHDGGREEPLVRRHLFCDWTASGLNNGWACVTLDPTANAAEAGKPTAILVDTIKGGGGVGGNGDYTTASREAPRVHPLTGDLEPKMFRKGGCGGLSQSQVLRSGSQSIYDFADDSGMRPLGGVKARCSSPQVAALGLLIYSEEAGHCECPFPVRTTLVMAPAEHRLNEDWAFFFARPADTYLRQAAINLGAPGDRRDDGGTLWLGYPRIPADRSRAFPIAAGSQYAVGANGVWLRVMSAALQVPLAVECFGAADAYRPEEDTGGSLVWSKDWSPGRNRKAFGPYRVNADRVAIQGTDRPWIYASGYRGVRKADVQLDFLKPIVSAPTTQPPALNGKLDGPVWQGAPQVRLPFTRAEVFVRHDAENLYVAARRPAVVSRLGKVSPWSKTTSGDDATVWQDDSFEIFLSDGRASNVVHLGVSASGARYDALSQAGAKEDAAWNGEWKSAVMAVQALPVAQPPRLEDGLTPPDDPADAPKNASRKDEAPLAFELAIPWKTIADAGLLKDRLAVNVQMNQKDTSNQPATSPGSAWNPKSQAASGEALCYLGIAGRQQCRNFAPLGIGAPPQAGPRSFTVRLHFAEVDDAKPGQRVFDVKLQGQTVLKALDIAKEAGVRTALVKEFPHIRAGDALALEFVPAATDLTPATAPILCALEIMEEGFVPPVLAQAAKRGSLP